MYFICIFEVRNKNVRTRLENWQTGHTTLFRRYLTRTLAIEPNPSRAKQTRAWMTMSYEAFINNIINKNYTHNTKSEQ